MEPLDLAPGGTPLRIAGRYEMIRELGRGGMGTVYLVRHINTDEKLAMKVLRKEATNQAEAVERFKREMKASAILKSENVARITDADTAAELDGAMYLVMELLDGCDVERLVRGGKPLPAIDIVWILGQAARALDKAHGLGIIHRDLKPENLFLHRSGAEESIVKVVDFGIAMFQTRFSNPDVRLTQSNTMLGTPLYMAPEQVLGSREEISPQTDMWAIGMIAYEMLAGKAYWNVPSVGMLLSKIALGEKPPPSKSLPSLPKEFDVWFARSCSHDCAKRWASVREQIEALAKALDVDPTWLDTLAAPPRLLPRMDLVAPRIETLSSTAESSAAASQEVSGVGGRGKTAPLRRTPPPTRLAAEASRRRRRLFLFLVFLIPAIGGSIVGLLTIRQRPIPELNGVTPQTPQPPPEPTKKPLPPGPPPALPPPVKSTAVLPPEVTDPALDADAQAKKKSHAKGKGKGEPKSPHPARDPGKRAPIDYDPVAP